MFKLKSLRCLGFKRLTIDKPLKFPDERLLIYGPNESGKSTIMEAIHYALYGLPLRPNRRAGNDDIINYNSQQAMVELKFSIDNDHYTARRVLRRKKSNIHELTIERHDGKKNHITGARNVSKTLEQELHGIDSDALLNSCLVEQKELGKLESASRSDRIRAMTTLLNLEAFVDAEQRIRETMHGLERTNRETESRLEKATQAKTQYEEASEKLEKARVRIEAIKIRLGKITKRIKELDKILTVIDEIKKLETNLQEAYNEAKRAKERVQDASKKLEESKAAKKRVETLNNQIQEVEPSRKAQALLPNIEKLIQEITTSRSETEKLAKNESGLKSKLESLKDVGKNIEDLEQQAQDLQKEKASLSQKRTVGALLAIAGSISCLAAIITSYLLLLGLPLVLMGLLVTWRNKPSIIDPKLNSVRNTRENMLGEKARINDYTSQLEETRNIKKTQEDSILKNEEELLQVLSQMPSKPRDYGSILKSDKEFSIKSLGTLRQAIQTDLESLVKLSTEHDEKEEVAIKISQRQQDLHEAETKHKEELARIESLKKERALKETTGVKVEEETKLRNERDNVKSEIGSLKTEREERQADVEESKTTMKETKELHQEHPELLEKDRKEKFEIESMRRAIKLLTVTRDAIVSAVKSHIETHMMRFLPSLTANRYSMARIDEQNYRIEVYDREARRWRGKGVFSGATQDQFSLALRLAFALSTIPSSRGARPGFIFLDEPLSGFDIQRRTGLLNLLQGELSSFFDQIIVISHLEELKDEFPQQVQLEAGSIV